MNRIFVLLVSVAATALAAGCGGGDDGVTASASSGWRPVIDLDP